MTDAELGHDGGQFGGVVVEGADPRLAHHLVNGNGANVVVVGCRQAAQDVSFRDDAHHPVPVHDDD